MVGDPGFRDHCRHRNHGLDDRENSVVQPNMIRDLKKLIRRAFPGFPPHHITRLGEVVAIADPPAEEQGTDRFRLF